jgi:hypothetical protein
MTKRKMTKRKTDKIPEPKIDDLPRQGVNAHSVVFFQVEISPNGGVARSSLPVESRRVSKGVYKLSISPVGRLLVINVAVHRKLRSPSVVASICSHKCDCGMCQLVEVRVESKSGPVDRGFHLSYTCDVGFPLGEDLKP